jgi:DNA-binding LacI/PurR family transcriptional regulator
MATLAEVARRAGVTTATVSNVLRNKGRVSAETRARVLAIVSELGYRPNLNARALVEGRPLTIALVVSSIANPFYPEFAEAVELELRKHGYFLLVCNTNNDPVQERAYLDAVGGSLAHGVLAMHTDHVQLDELLALRRAGIPVVLSMWERPDRHPELPCVAVNFYQAGVIAAEHLLSLGHTRIGAIVGSERTGKHVWRYRGFCDAMRAAGIEVPASTTSYGDDTIDAGRRAAYRLLTANPDLTALFASNDLPAFGALQAAAALGLDVPGDLSVTGLTDIQLAHQFRPALTTVAVSTHEAARLSVEMLLKVIEDGANASVAVWTAATPQLVVRDSTARPRASAA